MSMTSRRRSLLSREKCNQVGDFFELLTHRVVGGTLCPPNSSEGDIIIWRADTGIDVKSSDNNRMIRIERTQLETHEALTKGFPFRSYVYALCCYKNRSSRIPFRGKSRRSILARCRSYSSVHAFLSKSLDTIYLLELPIIRAIQKMHGVKRGCYRGKPESEVVVIGRRLLQGFNSINSHMILTYLGLEPSQWVIRERQVNPTFTIDLFKYSARFNVVEVFSNSLCKRLAHVAAPPRQRNPQSFMRIVPDSERLPWPHRQRFKIA